MSNYTRNYFSDVLDEGKLTEEKDDHLVSCTLESNTLGMSPFSLKKEVEEILELLKSTWCILGITKTIHYTCYAWVLFRQFVITGEQRILQYVIEQLKKVPLKEQRGPQENECTWKSLRSKVEMEKG